MNHSTGCGSSDQRSRETGPLSCSSDLKRKVQSARILNLIKMWQTSKSTVMRLSVTVQQRR